MKRKLMQLFESELSKLGRKPAGVTEIGALFWNNYYISLSLNFQITIFYNLRRKNRTQDDQTKLVRSSAANW